MKIINGIELTDKQELMLKQFATKQYPGAEDNVSTRFPTIHVVESRKWSTPLADGYGDTEHFGFDEEIYYTLTDLKEYLCNYFDDFNENEINNCSDTDELNDLLEDYTDNKIESYEVAEEWRPVAYFFIRKEAEDYLKYQSHNLGIARVYTYSTGYGNNGSMEELGNLLLTIGNKLNKEGAENE